MEKDTKFDANDVVPLPKLDKVDVEGGSNTEESSAVEGPPKMPWTYKWVALLCVVLFPMGTNWTNATLKPLKSTLRRELGITNTDFAVVSSADSIVNSVWPVFGGLLLDWYGPNVMVPACTGVIFLGSVISAIGVDTGMWRMLTGGQILAGFGIAVLDSAQQKFFYHYFGFEGFALVFGLENAVSKITSLVANLVAVPIAEETGSYVYSFWIATALCGVSFLLAIGYVLFERFFIPVPLRFHSARYQAVAQGKKGRFSFKILLIMPWVYLMLPMTQLLQSGAAGGFEVSSADIIFQKGYTERVAGFISSASNVLPIVLSPVVGFLIDRWGHRFHYVALAPIFWIICCSMIGFTDVHPLVALTFASLAGVINAMPLQICIPLLVADEHKLGTAFGIWRCFNNAGSTIMDLVFGIVQDGTPGQGYSRVLKLAIGLKAWAFALAIGYIVVDHKYIGKGMTMTMKQREARLEELKGMEVEQDGDALTRRTVFPNVSKAALALMTSMTIVAWVLFFKYLIV